MRISHVFLIVFFTLANWQATQGQQQTRSVAAPVPSPERTGETQSKGSAPGEQQQSTAGIIKGRVVGDNNRPLTNASVVARAVGGARDLMTSATDAEGNFELTNLRPAAYLVSAVARGYVPEMVTAPQQPANYARPGDSLTIRMVKGGVITGQVTDASGNPLVAARVHVLRVRDAQGQPLRLDTPKRFAPADDRGIYRHYGLEPGAYLVSVSGSSIFNLSPASSGDEPPSYYPAATRSTALEVVVGEGQEVGNINIQQRSQRGYAVSGYLSGTFKAGSAGNINVALVNAANGATEALLGGTGEGNTREFTFYGVAEGEYELTAQSTPGSVDAFVSPARRVSVKGKDVGGVELKLQPLGSIAGNITLEPAQSREPNLHCAERRTSRLEESVIQVRRSGAARVAEPLLSVLSPASSTTPDAKGAFILRDVPAGRYFLQLDLPDEDWFVRAVTARGVAPGRAQAFDAARHSLTLTPGAQLEGLTVNLGVGAASLRGRVTATPAEKSSPAQMIVYMVPSVREQAENALRYAATKVHSDGTFSFAHVAPGSYRLVAHAVTDEPSASDVQTLFADAAARARLLGEAEAANQLVTLQQCQRINNFSLRLK